MENQEFQDLLSTYSLTEYFTTISNFVKEICLGRDESHGYNHMFTVTKIALTIAMNDYSSHPNFQDLLQQVISVGMLHDVADKKYDLDGKLFQKLDEFGNRFFLTNYPNIKKTINLISFSSEDKAIKSGTPINYETELGEFYSLVRHIVSDADKLEAIGKVGIVRCKEYTKHKHPGITQEELVCHIKIHAEEKLLRLKDEFIRTPTGKRIAEILHSEMINELEQLLI
jgi:uncharacterized protein